MKFMTLSSWPVEKSGEVAAANDKVSADIPRERRVPGYVLMCALPDVPPNSMVSIAISEGDNMNEIAARIYPVMLAGATINIIPLLEVPAGGAAKVEKKYRGK
jgi:hypothetical protein